MWSQTLKQAADCTNILVLGDSFTAGVGINKVKDRFSNVLGSHLPESFCVYNAGVGGSDTIDEFRRLGEFPIKPDILVLAYFTNDAEQKIAHLQQGYDLVLPEMSFLETHSFLFNFLYWKYSGHNVTNEERERLIEFNGLLPYLEEEYFRAHLEDLYRFIDYSRRENVPLFAVVFPNMEAWALTSSYLICCKPIIQYFQDHNISVLDVFPLVKHISAKDRFISSVDGHASVKVNKLVGDALYKLIETELITVREH